MAAVETVFVQLASRVWAVSLEIAVLALLIWVLELVCRRTSSLFRYWLWFIVFLRLCLPFDITPPGTIQRFIVSNTNRVLPEIKTTDVYRSVSHETTKVMAFITGDTATGERLDNLVPQVDPLPKIKVRIVPLIWFGFVSALGLLFLVRLVIVRRIIGTSEAVENPELLQLLKKHAEQMGVNGDVGLLSLNLDTFNVPATFGIIHPRIIIPYYIAETWTEDEIEPILLHELAHIKRHDILVNWLQIVVQAVYFFHPAVWLVNSRIRELREELCDDTAIYHLNGGCVRYTKSILRVMESISFEPSFGSLGLGLAKRSSVIGKRIKRIMNARHTITLTLPMRSVTALIVIGLAGSAIAGISAVPTHSYDESIVKHHSAVASTTVPDTSPATIGVVHGALYSLTKKEKPALENLARAVNAYTNLDILSERHLAVIDEALFDTPFLYLPAASEVFLSPFERARLRKYLMDGGFIVLDNAAEEPKREAVGRSFERLGRELLGANVAIYPLSDDHELYHAYFDFDAGTPYGAWKNPERVLYGISFAGRLVGLISNSDFAGRWSENESNEPQLKFGVNMVVFALQQKGGLYRQQLEREEAASTAEPEKNESEKVDVVLQLSHSVMRGSERVFLDGKPLVPGTGYSITYETGEINILNDRIRSRRTDLQIQYDEDTRKNCSLDINIYDTGKASPKTRSTSNNTLSMNARVGYDDGSAVYIMNLK